MEEMKMKKRTKQFITFLIAVAVAVTALPGGMVKAANAEESWTRKSEGLKNYAWTGTVTSSNTSESLAASYPAEHLTDGGPWATRAFSQAAVINYTEENLAYYEVALPTAAKINQVRLAFNQAEANRRPRDIAIDIKASDDKWVRVAERHNINYETQLIISGTSVKALDFNFAAIDGAKAIRVTANRNRNYADATNFALMQLEAYMDEALTSTDYTGTTKDANDSYNIPELENGGTEGGDTPTISKNYALNGEVTSSNTSEELGGKYPASLITDGISYYTRPAGQNAVINYTEAGLAYYQVKLTEEAELNQVRVYFSMHEPEKRPKDIAVDVKKADGTWVRAAEMHNIDYDKDLIVTDNPRYLAFNFEKVEATDIRVTANRARNVASASNFRLMEVEAYLDPAVTTYTGTTKDSNNSYNIPELGTSGGGSESGEPTTISKNYALNGEVTSSNTNKELGEKYPASLITDGIPYYTRPAGQSAVINYTPKGLAAYQIKLTEKAELNQVRVYFNMAEPEKRPKDIAVDVKKANGTWVRVAEMHNIDYDKDLIVTDNPRYLAFNFEKIEGTAIRVTANNARNSKSSTNFRLMEVEAYYDPAITTYTGTTKDANNAYNIPLNGGAPATGDVSNAALPTTVCLMGLFGIAALLVWKKKSRVF